MKYCGNCKVSVAGERETCPLCQSVLTQNDKKGGEEVFPSVPTIYHQYHFLFKILLFVSFAIVVVAVSVNLLFSEGGWWSLFAVGGVGCTWLSLALAIRKRKNIPKGMLYQVVLISLICVGWDLAVGWRGWSVDFIIPILCVAAMVTLSVLSVILKWKLENIIVYFCIAAMFGIIPIVFFLTGLLRVAFPSVICVACSVISLAAIIIFYGGSIWAELKRRLYM